MSQPRTLYDLQQIDTEIRSRKQRLGEVLRLQKEPAALTVARRNTQAIEDDLRERRSQRENLVLEIAGLTDKIKRSEERLYSGVVKNPKELADLQQEVEALGRRRSSLEDEALLMMMAIDERKAIKATAEAEVETMAQEFESASIDLRKEQNTLALQLNRLLEKQKRQQALVQPSILKTYDDLIRQKNGLAVAGLRGNKCLGCQVTLSANVVRAADEGKFVYCDSCGRILCSIA